MLLTKAERLKYAYYGKCHRCGSMPGEPCCNVRSLPRYHDVLDKPHKYRLKLVRVQAKLPIVPRQCASYHQAYRLRCGLGVHPDMALHFNYDLGILIQWYDSTKPEGIYDCLKSKGMTTY